MKGQNGPDVALFFLCVLKESCPTWGDNILQAFDKGILYRRHTWHYSWSLLLIGVTPEHRVEKYLKKVSFAPLKEMHCLDFQILGIHEALKSTYLLIALMRIIALIN